MSDNGQTDVRRAPNMPKIRTVRPGDIVWILKAGIRDFLRAPWLGLFFGGIYAAGGLIILGSLTRFDMPWMIFPVAIGFPLVGPFIAVGLYEVSRRLAAGEPLTWSDVLLVIFRQRERELGWISFVVLFIFWIWIYQVRLLLALFLGFKSFTDIGKFVEIVTTTPEGLGFLAVGTIVGGLLAMILFSTTVIAMPLLLDRDLDFVSAMIVSVRTVLENPVAMIGWGIIVTGLAILAMLPAFLGLLVVLPVLGHATWHLYVRTIEWNP